MAIETPSNRRRGDRKPTALVCIVASYGGIKALSGLVKHFPNNLSAAVIIVQHLHPGFRSRLGEIIAWNTNHRVCVPENGEPIEAGVLYVAAPGTHVLVTEDQRLALSDTAQVLNVRPSGDLLLASAAQHFDGRVIGIILTGTGHDGSDGAMAVHNVGGTIIVQDPESATRRSMPDSAIATGSADFVLSLNDIGQWISTILESGAKA